MALEFPHSPATRMPLDFLTGDNGNWDPKLLQIQLIGCVVPLERKDVSGTHCPTGREQPLPEPLPLINKQLRASSQGNQPSKPPGCCLPKAGSTLNGAPCSGQAKPGDPSRGGYAEPQKPPAAPPAFWSRLFRPGESRRPPRLRGPPGRPFRLNFRRLRADPPAGKPRSGPQKGAGGLRGGPR